MQIKLVVVVAWITFIIAITILTCVLIVALIIDNRGGNVDSEKCSFLHKKCFLFHINKSSAISFPFWVILSKTSQWCVTLIIQSFFSNDISSLFDISLSTFNPVVLVYLILPFVRNTCLSRPCPPCKARSVSKLLQTIPPCFKSSFTETAFSSQCYAEPLKWLAQKIRVNLWNVPSVVKTMPLTYEQAILIISSTQRSLRREQH